MQGGQAKSDLGYIRNVLERTERAVDPHAFHFVIWGALVLVWYPLANWFQLRGRMGEMFAVMAAALFIGSVLSTVLEVRLRVAPRIRSENTYVGRQIVTIVWGALVPAILLSAAGPPLELVAGPHIPLVWGLAYAVMAYGLGVVYRREFFVSAAAIFVAFLVALRFADYAGYILGPAMGLGLLIPGVMAESRVRRWVHAHTAGGTA